MTMSYRFDLGLKSAMATDKQYLSVAKIRAHGGNMHRYIEQSQQGLRFDIMTPDNRRICIAHSKADAAAIVAALDAQEAESRARSAKLTRPAAKAKQ